VKTRSIRYKYLSIDTLRPVKSLQSHLNGPSTDVSIDSRFGSGLSIGLHVLNSSVESKRRCWSFMSVHSLRDSVHNAFATIHLFRDCFARKCENSRVTKVRTLSRCWVTIISPTGGSQQRFVSSQTKMLPGYPRALFVKPLKGVPGFKSLLTTPGRANYSYPTPRKCPDFCDAAVFAFASEVISK